MKTIGCQRAFCFCVRTAPSPIPDPSVSTRNGPLGVGMANAGAVVIAVLRALKAFWQFSSYTNSFFSEVRAFRGHATCVKFRVKHR